jgi:hypothetical protein
MITPNLYSHWCIAGSLDGASLCFCYTKTTLLLPLVALGGDLLLMESALAVGRKERLFLSVRGSKGVWGMEDSPTITAKHHAAAGFYHQRIRYSILFRPCWYCEGSKVYPEYTSNPCSDSVRVEK